MVLAQNSVIVQNRVVRTCIIGVIHESSTQHDMVFFVHFVKVWLHFHLLYPKSKVKC